VRSGSLPWLPVQKDYRFDTEEGPKMPADLFDGRSQLPPPGQPRRPPR
jgi:predicted dithiol-disulfide oxidoreductase (DUF899 family)